MFKVKVEKYADDLDKEKRKGTVSDIQVSECHVICIQEHIQKIIYCDQIKRMQRWARHT